MRPVAPLFLGLALLTFAQTKLRVNRLPVKENTTESAWGLAWLLQRPARAFTSCATMNLQALEA